MNRYQLLQLGFMLAAAAIVIGAGWLILTLLLVGQRYIETLPGIGR